MAILRVRDKDGNVIPIPAIKGDKGDPYVLTEADKKEMVEEVTKAGAGKKLPTGGGEIFNDYENNDSNIPYAHITGRNNKAVVRCFLIKSFTADTITLDSVEGIEVGMPFNVFCPDEEEGYDKHRGKILSIDSTTNTVTLDNDGVQITNIDTWSGFAPSSEPTFFNTFICNGGTIGTYVINDVDFEYFTVTMSGENNIAYLNTRVHGTSNKGLAFNAVIDGYKCIVRGERGVAFNYKTEANGNESFAINLSTKANGAGSFAQGSLTEANGAHASSFGRGTVASGYASMARGKYNTIDEEGIYLEQVGNGSDANNRSDAYTLDKDGNGRFGKDVYADKNKKLATEIFVTNKNIEILADAKNYAKNYAEQKKKAANEYTDECISNLSYMTYKGSTNEIPEDGGNFGDTYTATEDITLSIKRFRVPTMGGITFKPEDDVILSTTIFNNYLWDIQHFENLIKILDGGYAGSKLYQDGEIITKEITFKKPRKLFIWAAGKIDSENFAETFEVEATGFMADGNNGTVRLLGKWINDHGIGYNCKINTISGWIYYHTDNVYHNDSELYDIENVYKYHTGIKPVASTITFPKNSTIHRSENDGWVTLAKNQVTEDKVQTLIAEALNNIGVAEGGAY